MDPVHATKEPTVIIASTVIAVIAVLYLAAKVAASRRAKGRRCYPAALVVALLVVFGGASVALALAGLRTPAIGAGILAGWFLLEGVFDAWKNSSSGERAFSEPAAPKATSGE